MGYGKGEGEGQGTDMDRDSKWVIGGTISIVLTVFMCVCGVPMIIAGAVLIYIARASIFINDFTNPFLGWGIGLIVVSGVLLIAGVIMIILVCTRRTREQQPQHVMVTTAQPPPNYAMGGYPGQQQYAVQQQYVAAPMQHPQQPQTVYPADGYKM